MKINWFSVIELIATTRLVSCLSATVVVLTMYDAANGFNRDGRRVDDVGVDVKRVERPGRVQII